MNVLLTIVIAAYNSEKTIERSLQSLLPFLSQGADVIVIDDGSTDKTYEVVEKFCMQEKRVSILKQEHNGSASARNLGLQNVKSKFVIFCDADDELILFNLSMLNSLDSDFVICNYVYVTSTKINQIVRNNISNEASNVFEFSSEKSRRMMNQVGFWRYVYRTNFLKEKQIRFVGTLNELRSGYFVLDDYFFLLHVLSSYNSGVSWDIIVYKYFENTAANLHRFRKQSRYMARAAMIQIDESYERLPLEGRLWYREELRRQLLSSFQAIFLRDAYLTWWEFCHAIWKLGDKLGASNLKRGLIDTSLITWYLIRKTAVKMRDSFHSMKQIF